ncbi:hypothetical protein [Pseudoalteromonas sp. BSi20495]|uniref:hypothetical protein n=1 Tax=Pseudoalteromonas sp. BSi20495 TaxID=386429 RepID=UPI00023163A1|nr:hypothetical protein [Pseudoalteromonas sp. BSi20495]GAA80820.1 hypothetical protein P20495_3342 [Pseudoalteromonas sp. BSi20495]
MNNFVNVIQKLEELSARDSNKARSLNLLNSVIYQVRADMNQYLGMQTTDLHRVEDIADVLGYAGRVVAASDDLPMTPIEPAMFGATEFYTGDYFLVKNGPDRGIYPITIFDDGAGFKTYDLDPALKRYLGDVAVVVLKLVENDLVQKHSIFNLSNDIWQERVIA